MTSVLFVDDHEVLARLSAEILEMQGYRAEVAVSAEDAIQKVGSGSFDFVVTDYRLAPGMSGKELAIRLRESNPEIPVIVFSGYTPVECTGNIVASLDKEDLFPALLEKLKVLSKQT